MGQLKAEVWERWRGWIAEQERSGQAVSAYCSERGLRSGQFFAWRKKLRDAAAAKFVSVEIARGGREGSAAVKVADRAIEVRLREGRSLVVEPGFDAQHLRALVKALEA